ncbi:hypothetical protein BH11BAC4_BH11BAC4_25730 [soil metagenome]
MLAEYMQTKDNAYNDLKIRGLYRTIAYAVGVAPLAATYVGVFALAFNTAFGKKILAVLAPVGKMAFTNYVLHTIIGSIFFLHPGLNYMGTMGPVYYTLFGLVVFIFQIIGSHLWLKYFNYGSVEWIWRSSTYMKWRPMKKQ